MLRVVLICIVAGCVAAPRATSELAALAPQTTTGRLANGLEYVVITTRGRGRVSLGIHAGPLQERDDEVGAAGALAETLAQMSPGVTARASHDFTDVVLVDEDADAGLARLRAWLDTQPTDFALARATARPAREAAVQLTQRARVSGTRLRLHDEPRAVNRTGVDLAMLQRFRDRWYTPARMTLVVEGPWPRDRVRATLERRFGDLTSRASPTEPAFVDGPRQIVVGGPDEKNVMFAFLVPAPPVRARVDLRAEVIRGLFERALARRLRQAPIQRGTARSVRVEEQRLSREMVSVEVLVDTSVDGAATAGDVARELERVRRDGFDRAELHAARFDKIHADELLLDVEDEAEDCVDVAARARRGYAPLPCDDEYRLRDELKRAIDDAEINALRAWIDPRRAAVAVAVGDRPTTPELVRSAIDDAVGELRAR